MTKRKYHMRQQIFNSQHPILEACMNKGSSVELAVAVHQAGAYPSLCSWTYNGKPNLLRQDLEKFIKHTGSNCVHVSFELYEFESSIVQSIVKDYQLPTIEIIYGQSNSFRSMVSDAELEHDLLALLHPIKNQGTRIFKRIYDEVSAEQAKRHLLDGFCIKGMESAGLGSFTPVKELFGKQQQLTPDLALIPYGGVGTGQQVKEYMDLGAEMVAVGTLFALSKESTIKFETKKVAVSSSSRDLNQFVHELKKNDQTVIRKQNALQLEPYKGPDDANGTIGLVKGMFKKNTNTGHVYLGHSIDHVTEILSCQQIVNNLTKLL